jgi:hypothetical protein
VAALRLPQIGIKHTNLLWKNSDRILASFIPLEAAIFNGIKKSF